MHTPTVRLDLAIMKRKVCPLPAPNWSRPLPRPITIPDVMELATLPDVRILVEKHLPKEYRSKFCWRQLAGLLKRAAEGPHSHSIRSPRPIVLAKAP